MNVSMVCDFLLSVTDVVCHNVILLGTAGANVMSHNVVTRAARRPDTLRGLAGSELLQKAGFVLYSGVVLALAELVRHGCS